MTAEGARPAAAPVVLGVAGCSGSGKTTLAARLAWELGGLHFHFDNYYRDLSHLDPTERALTDFDDPEILERPLLAAQLGALARGEAIEQPVYDFATHARVAGRTVCLKAEGFLVVEGIFALHYEELLPVYDLRVFVEAPIEVCFERRLRRDVEERGRTAESVRRQWERTVRPSAERFVLPTAVRADLVVAGDGELDRGVSRVLAALRERGRVAGLR